MQADKESEDRSRPPFQGQWNTRYPLVPQGSDPPQGLPCVAHPGKGQDHEGLKPRGLLPYIPRKVGMGDACVLHAAFCRPAPSRMDGLACGVFA